MTLYIIRHGETELNRQNIVQGSGVDSNLNNTGRRQAQLFYQYYRTVKFDLVLTSALKRTHQTVEPFILRGGVEVMNMPELNEISWGVHEGKVGDLASAASYKTMINHWQSENYDACIEGGESAAE